MKGKSIIQRFSLCAVLIFMILTSGCATTTRVFTGEVLPKEQIAIIEGSEKYCFFDSQTVGVWAVDGVPCYCYEVKVLPGWHEIEVSVSRLFSGSIWVTMPNRASPDCYSLRFYAMPGHKYRVKSSLWETKGGLVTIVDTRSGEIVVNQPRRNFQTCQEINRKSWNWHKPSVDIEQFKQDYGECKTKHETPGEVLH